MIIDIEQFKTIFYALEKDDETKDYKPVETDLFVLIDGYIFVLQTENGFNNVIVKKWKHPSINLIEAFKAFRDTLQNNDIQYVRVEGSLKRYKCLEKYFDVIKDNEIKDRNVYYIKIF